MTGAPHAQAPSKTEKVVGSSTVQAVKMTGEVVWVNGNWLLAKMEPLGNYSLFDVKPGREFVIDGQKKLIADLKPGTVLNGMISNENDRRHDSHDEHAQRPGNVAAGQLRGPET